MKTPENSYKQLLEFLNTEIENFEKLEKLHEESGNTVDANFNSGAVASLEIVKYWIESNE